MVVWLLRGVGARSVLGSGVGELWRGLRLWWDVDSEGDGRGRCARGGSQTGARRRRARGRRGRFILPHLSFTAQVRDQARGKTWCQLYVIMFGARRLHGQGSREEACRANIASALRMAVAAVGTRRGSLRAVQVKWQTGRKLSEMAAAALSTSVRF